MSVEEFNKLFAKNLINKLYESGKTQADLARYLGVSKSTVTSWCKGEKSPRMGKVDAMCEWLGCKRSDLMEDKFTNTEQYYYNDDTAKLAEELRRNKDLCLLFDAARDVPTEDLKLVHDMLLRMKKTERHED